jgi:hypothetical protein
MTVFGTYDCVYLRFPTVLKMYWILPHSYFYGNLRCLPVVCGFCVTEILAVIVTKMTDMLYLPFYKSVYCMNMKVNRISIALSTSEIAFQLVDLLGIV